MQSLLNSDSVLCYLVRHGTTILNEQHKFRGPRNVPLDAAGYRDANKLATLFEPVDLALIFTSPKIRAFDTAKIIAGRKGMQPVMNEGLLPWDIGDFGGLEKNAENVQRIQRYICEPDVPTPNGEALDNFRGRIHPLVLDGVRLAEHLGKPVMIVGHSSVIHEASALIVGDHMACKVKPGGVVAVYVENGILRACPIFKQDKAGTSQNTLGGQPHGTTIS